MRVGILTVSDSAHRGEREDQSGAEIRRYVEGAGDAVLQYRVVPDDVEEIRRALCQMVDDEDLDVVLTTGGTGLSPRDVTPEATRFVIEREIPGMGEAMRAESLAKTRRAMLSRGIAGTRRGSIIVNLPGSARGALECLAVVYDQLSHGVALLQDRPVDH